MGRPATTPFDVTAIAIQRYQHHKELDGLVDDAAALAELLGRLGGVAAARSAGPVLSKAEAESQLGAWWKDRRLPSSMLVWMGHGWSNGAKAALACSDTPEQVAPFGVGPETVANHLDQDWAGRKRDDHAWTVVFIDACGGKHFVSQVSMLIEPQQPTRLALFGVSGTGATYVGRLRRALARVLGRLSSNTTVVDLQSLLTDLGEDLGEQDHRRVIHQLPRVGLHYDPPVRAVISASLDIYQELIDFLEVIPADERELLFPTGQAAEQGAFGSGFVGRDTDRAAIWKWLRTAERGTLIVHGRPGCGKSALLSDLLLRSRPAWRAHFEGAPETVAGIPPDGVFDAAVHLASLSTGEIVGRLAEALGVALPADVLPGEDVDRLVHEISDRPFTVLVDGLDEAIDPVAVASTVLQRLAGLPAGRIVVGTRSSTSDAVDSPPSGAANLIEALGDGTRKIELRRDPAALGEYVRRRLAGVGPDADVGRLAGAFGGLDAGKDFLFARLAVHEIQARPELLTGPALDELLAADHRGLFRMAVDRLAASMPNAVPLLEALAFGHGKGLPRAEGVWARVAGGIAEVGQIPASDIDQLLTAAAPYILLDVEDGQDVYRLAHQTYRTIFPWEK